MDDYLDAETQAEILAYDEEHANDSREIEYYGDDSENEGDQEPNEENEGEEGDEDRENEDGDEGITIDDLAEKAVSDEENEENEDYSNMDLNINPVYVNGADITDILANELESKTGEERFLYANISPAVLTGEDGKQIVAYGASSIPKDFKFASDADVIKAQNEFARISRQANDLKKEYSEIEEMNQKYADATAQAKADMADISDLQNGGLIPRFSNADTIEDLSEDPAAELVDMILGFKNEMNEYYEQQGLNRNVGFREAYNEFMRQNPDIADAIESDKNENSDLKAEDEERIKIAKRTNSARTVSPSNKSGRSKVREPDGLRTVSDWADWAATVNPEDL